MAADRQEPDGAGAEDDHQVVGPGRAPQGGVDAAGQWLDQHRRLVGERLRHRMDLARVGDQLLSPAATGVSAIAGLEADPDRAFGDVLTEAGTAFGAARAGWVDAPDSTPQSRLDHDSRSVVEHPHHLVAGHEWVAGERLQIEGRVAGDGGQVGAADAGQIGPHSDPVRRRQLELRDVAELEH
jgi:hypothetical protein